MHTSSADWLYVRDMLMTEASPEFSVVVRVPFVSLLIARNVSLAKYVNWWCQQRAGAVSVPLSSSSIESQLRLVVDNWKWRSPLSVAVRSVSFPNRSVASPYRPIREPSTIHRSNLSLEPELTVRDCNLEGPICQSRIPVAANKSSRQSFSFFFCRLSTSREVLSN